MLSTTSQYAIRALSHLARMQHGEAVLGRDLAERASVPVNYLSKIMLVMRNAGLVQATRGAGGGYRLARPAAAIRLIDIEHLDLNACGGTHVRATGQIGGLLIRRTEKVTRGVRVTWRPARRARPSGA